MPVLATWSPFDAVLDVVAPLGLAASVGTALVVDLDPHGPAREATYTLADLVRRGPTGAELGPTSRGTAFLANGGVDAADAAPVVEALAQRWPSVVLRCPPRVEAPPGAITFVPLLPDPFGLSGPEPVIYQRYAMSPPGPAGAFVLPPPSVRTVVSLLEHRMPVRRDRWIKGLRSVWGGV
jgi:hypothetical protein